MVIAALHTMPVQHLIKYGLLLILAQAPAFLLFRSLLFLIILFFRLNFVNFLTCHFIYEFIL